MSNQRKFQRPTLAITLILLVLFGNITPSQATPPLTKCNIRISDPHFSNSLKQGRNLVAVKVNARSRCNRQMSNLVLTVVIHKIGFLFDYKVARGEVKIEGPISPNTLIKNQKTYVECKNSKKSRYFGEAFASGTIKGENVKTFHVLSEKTLLFECGN